MNDSSTLRDLLPTLAVSAVVAWCGAMGASYVLGQGEAAFSPVVMAAITLVGTVFFACISILVNLAYEGYLLKTATTETAMVRTPASTSRAHRLAARLARITPQWSRRSVALFCAVMFLFWLPWLIANYPGGAYWDTFYQIHQCFPENHPISIVPFGDHAEDTLTDAYFCDHHPLFDTLVYGGFAAISQALTDSWNLGSFAFVVLQGAATIVALTASVAYLRKLGAPPTLCFIAFAYFCIMPFVSTWALTMVKDSLFSLVYIPYFMMLLAAIATRGESLARPRAIVLFICLGVLLCLTKKTGIYVVLPTAIVAFCVLAWSVRRETNPECNGGTVLVLHSTEERSGQATATGECNTRTVPPLHRHRVRRLAVAFGGQALACLLVMQLVLPWAVFPLLNVAPGGAQEALGLPLQQTAAFVHAYHDEVTPDERAAIDAIIPYHKVEEEYDPVCQDAVKYWYRQDSPPEEVQEYLHTWAAMGMRHPEVYLGALFAIAGSYLAPCQSLNIRTTTCDTWQDGTHVLYNPESLAWLREGMANLYNGYAQTLVICLPVQAVIWVFWLPALLLLTAWRFRPRDLLLFVPGAIVLAFCVIGPIFDARYCLPLLYTVPLLACFVFRKNAAKGRSSSRTRPDRSNEREAISNVTSGVPLRHIQKKGSAHDRSTTSGRDNHGIDLRHGRDAAVHGPAGCVWGALRSESGQRAPHA